MATRRNGGSIDRQRGLYFLGSTHIKRQNRFTSWRFLPKGPLSIASLAHGLTDEPTASVDFGAFLLGC